MRQPCIARLAAHRSHGGIGADKEGISGLPDVSLAGSPQFLLPGKTRFGRKMQKKIKCRSIKRRDYYAYRCPECGAKTNKPSRCLRCLRNKLN
jgi:hypothetical protein